MSLFQKTVIVFALTAACWIAILGAGYLMDKGIGQLFAPTPHAALMAKVMLEDPIQAYTA